MFSYTIYQDFHMLFSADVRILPRFKLQSFQRGTVDRLGFLFKHTQYGYGWHVDFLAKELIVEPTFLSKKSVLKPDAYTQSHRSLDDDDDDDIWEGEFGALGGEIKIDANGDHVDVEGTYCFHYETPLELTNANFGTLWKMSRDGKLLVEGHEPIVGNSHIVGVTVRANNVFVYGHEN